jgi:hypothetical protein
LPIRSASAIATASETMSPCVMSTFARIRTTSTVMPSAIARACAKAADVKTKICGRAISSLCHGPVERS